MLLEESIREFILSNCASQELANPLAQEVFLKNLSH